jgi:hypothetical protein
MSIAAQIALLIAALAGLGSLWGLAAPDSLMLIIDRFASRKGLVFAVVLRLALAAALWFSSTESRAPWLLQGLAILALTAALGLPFLGVERFKAFLGWWRTKSSRFVRGACVFGIAFSAAVLWALVPG